MITTSVTCGKSCPFASICVPTSMDGSPAGPRRSADCAASRRRCHVPIERPIGSAETGAAAFFGRCVPCPSAISRALRQSGQAAGPRASDAQWWRPADSGCAARCRRRSRGDRAHAPAVHHAIASHVAAAQPAAASQARTGAQPRRFRNTSACSPAASVLADARRWCARTAAVRAWPLRRAGAPPRLRGTGALGQPQVAG